MEDSIFQIAENAAYNINAIQRILATHGYDVTQDAIKAMTTANRGIAKNAPTLPQHANAHQLAVTTALSRQAAVMRHTFAFLTGEKAHEQIPWLEPQRQQMPRDAALVPATIESAAASSAAATFITFNRKEDAKQPQGDQRNAIWGALRIAYDLETGLLTCCIQQAGNHLAARLPAQSEMLFEVALAQMPHGTYGAVRPYFIDSVIDENYSVGLWRPRPHHDLQPANSWTSELRLAALEGIRLLAAAGGENPADFVKACIPSNSPRTGPMRHRMARNLYHNAVREVRCTPLTRPSNPGKDLLFNPEANDVTETTIMRPTARFHRRHYQWQSGLHRLACPEPTNEQARFTAEQAGDPNQWAAARREIIAELGA